MPSRIIRWRCNKCQHRFATYREAESCEIGHIATDAVASFKADLDRIFSGQPKRKASRP